MSINANPQTIHEDLSPFLPEEHPVAQALRSGKPIHNVIMGNINLMTGEITWIKMDAVPQFLPGESQPYQVYAVLDDITTRKRAEAERDRALDEAMRRAAELDAVFNSIADGVMLTDFNGEVLRLNPAAERIFDYSQEQLKLPMNERGRLPRLLTANGQPLSNSDYPVVKRAAG